MVEHNKRLEINMLKNILKKEYPICVDLDGTLLEGSSLKILIKEYFKTQPSNFLSLRASRWPEVKKNLSKIDIDVKQFPYRKALVEELKMLCHNGREIFLVTGADQAIAEKVVRYLDFFKEGIGSNGKIHLVGKNKAEYLKKRFGAFRFSYIGDSYSDLAVWKWAHSIVTVSSSVLLTILVKWRKKKHQYCYIYTK